MRGRTVIALFLVALFSAAPVTSFATNTASPHPSPSAMHTKPTLTQAQKDAISAARSIFAAALLNAQNGLGRALADAQAVLDQAISVAGTNTVAIRAAKKDFKESYRIIYRAYTTALNNAKSILQSAIATALAATKS